MADHHVLVKLNYIHLVERKIMKLTKRLGALTAALIVAPALATVPAATAVTTSVAQAQPITTYEDYSRMMQQSAGQFTNVATGDVAGQWAWNPVSATESGIQWGYPSTWPPTYTERFIVDGDWILLDGWSDNGTYYKLDVQQWKANVDCVTNRVHLPSGQQRYVQRIIPAVGQGYCLFAMGTITEQSSGKKVFFTHQQKWRNRGTNCSSPEYGTQECLLQTEIWSDDNGKEFQETIRREVYLAKDMGMAFWQTNYHPGTWNVKSRYQMSAYWTW